MSDQMVLLTGATGFVGFRILEKLIAEGFRVRLALRSETRLSALSKALKQTGKDTSSFEHVIVPDMMQLGAFQDAIKGVTYVVHVASPLNVAADDWDASIIRPAVSVTEGILDTILRSPDRTVKKIVITSSVAAVAPSEPRVFDADNVEPDPKGPWPNQFAAYSASKKLALNATRRFIQEQKPYFNVINVMPAFLVGPNGFAGSRKEYEEGSNAIPLAPLLGQKPAGHRPGFACHVDDVAAVHVAALQPSITGHRNFGVNYDGKNGVEWNQAIAIIKQKMPEGIGPELFPLGGSIQTVKMPFDASKTERELGMVFKDYETMVVDLARAYLATAA